MRRVYGPDLMLEVCQWSETSGCRHFFYGGAPGVAEALRDRLTARFPKLAVVGCLHATVPATEPGGAGPVAGDGAHRAAGCFLGRL